jgi:hypothetical protein
MKQQLMLLGCIFSLFLSGCKKDLPGDAPENAVQLQTDAAGSDAARLGQCRLTSAIRDNVFGTFLQYNNRGLVSEWKQDNFDGLPFIETYTYDLFGRLKTSHAVDNYIGASYDVKYLYQGNRLVKQTVKLAGTSTVTNEFVNTYNNRGQITRRESTLYPVYCTFTYNLLGNNTQVDYYVDGSLYLKEEFTYRQFNRNPYLAAYGIPYITYAYDFVFSKWWETSDKFTIYDNGVPTVIVDYDPATAILVLGPQQFLTSVTNFDRVTQSNTSAYFNYDNCTCAPGKTFTNSKVSPNSVTDKLILLDRFKRAFVFGNVLDIKAKMKDILSK